MQISQRFITGIVPVSSCRNEECSREIEKALMEKLDSMVKRELYTTFKTAPTEEEREKARKSIWISVECLRVSMVKILP